MKNHGHMGNLQGGDQARVLRAQVSRWATYGMLNSLYRQCAVVVKAAAKKGAVSAGQRSALLSPHRAPAAAHHTLAGHPFDLFNAAESFFTAPLRLNHLAATALCDDLS